MRHRNTTKILHREIGPRKALMRGLATNFVLYDKIKTTEAKAKALKPIVEKYISLAKKSDLNTRRELMRYFYTEGAVKKLMEVIGPKFKERNGGYTRIVKLSTRKGDNASMVQLELV